jgi:acyl-CoA dehydrogenase
MALKVVDRAMQAFGAEGICQDQPLAQMWAGLRTLRYADVRHAIVHSVCLAHAHFLYHFQGPDEVHMLQIGRQELKRVPDLNARTKKINEKRLLLEKASGEKVPAKL